MTLPDPSSSVPPPPPAHLQADSPSGIRSRSWDRPLAIAAWVALVGLLALTVVLQSVRYDESRAGHAVDSTSSETSSEEDGGLALRVAELQSRYLVGTAAYSEEPGGVAPSALVESAEVLESGPVSQRLRFLVVASELGGPQAGLDAAARLRADLAAAEKPISEKSEQTLEVIESTFAARAAAEEASSADGAGAATPMPMPTPDDAAMLKEQLGWFGDLLLNPRGGDAASREELLRPAKILVVAMVALIGGAVLLAVLGAVGLVILLVLAITGSWRPRLETGVARGGVYVETFLVWMLCFVVGSLVVGGLLPDLPLVGGGLAMAASVVALAWPVMRGIAWSDVRRDIGLHTGRGVLLEAGCGIAAYAMSLPFVAVGVGVMLALMAFTGASMTGDGGRDLEVGDTPAHPLLEVMAGGTTAKVMAFTLAVVLAPLVEEIFFRGVLYRHLREGTRRTGRLASIALSMLVMSFIFAAIHPQGLFAIPVLMALACGFAFAREWRDSLVPGMVAHALNNGAVVTLMAFAFA